MATKTKSKGKSKGKSAPTKRKRYSKELAEFAKSKNVTTEFFSVEGGKILRTSDGKRYATHEQCFADGVARDWSNITVLS